MTPQEIDARLYALWQAAYGADRRAKYLKDNDACREIEKLVNECYVLVRALGSPQLQSLVRPFR